jgi:outer membrane protein assembly factor BamD (BamD/ComL family)
MMICSSRADTRCRSRHPRPPRLLVAAVLGVALAACGSEDRAWRRAEEARTAEAYREFLRTYPTGAHRVRAYLALSDAQLDAGELEAAIASSGEVIRPSTDATEAARARAQIARARFGLADRSARVSDLEAFLSDFPESELTERARARIAELHLAEATRAGTPEAFERFLELHPTGRYGDEGRRQLAGLLDERAWNAAQAANTVDAYERYTATHPAGRFVSAATDRIRALRSFTGTIVGWSQGFAALTAGVEPQSTVDFELREHGTRAFAVDMRDAAAWGLIKQDGPWAKVVAKGWKVTFEVSDRCEMIRWSKANGTSGITESCAVRTFTRVEGG